MLSEIQIHGRPPGTHCLLRRRLRTLLSGCWDCLHPRSQLQTQSCEVLCLGSARISGKHASCETTVRVVKDGPDQPTALRTGCAHHCDDFSVAHCDLPLVLLGMCFKPSP